jgi:hypothetical protein
MTRQFSVCNAPRYQVSVRNMSYRSLGFVRSAQKRSDGVGVRGADTRWSLDPCSAIPAWLVGLIRRYGPAFKKGDIAPKTT